LPSGVKPHDPAACAVVAGRSLACVFGKTEASHAKAPFAKPGNRQYTAAKNFPSITSQTGCCNRQMFALTRDHLRPQRI
jgi:hypothetical protein